MKLLRAVLINLAILWGMVAFVWLKSPADGTFMAIIGLALMAIGVYVFKDAAQYRLPGEGWDHWWGRTFRRDGRRSYAYAKLDCGHSVQIVTDRRRVSVGDQVWCPGHRAFGPAQLESVTEPDFTAKHTLTGCYLQDDLQWYPTTTATTA